MSSRRKLNRFRNRKPKRISLGDIDSHLDELMRLNPCMENHQTPRHLDGEAELRWIDAMLSDHELNGPCGSRTGPDWRDKWMTS